LLSSTIDHAQGLIVKSGSTYSYDYTIQDHLGNNRSGFAQGISVTVPNFTADYYPFGLRYLQYERPGSPTNHYLYNSNEWQAAIKQYDFNVRFYDPVIARFAQVDPLADMFGQQTESSYAAFWNSPVTKRLENQLPIVPNKPCFLGSSVRYISCWICT
jgi:RHS repeat-associated protein